VLPDDRRLILNAGLPVAHLATAVKAFLAVKPTSPPLVAWTVMLDELLGARQAHPAASHGA
jgi:hypothetical protein